jgi:hypothetical protein
MIRDVEPQSAKTAAGGVADWEGTERYRVRRCVGAGAVGAVYEAMDAERGIVVAVKRLRHFSPAALYDFKREFRTLAGVHHPNLVRLHELVATEDREVFFTMELVRGVDVVAHARPGGTPDFDRLRAALRQLAEGVQALHAAGKLHRDIKPSNVLVTAEGRVVLLDFGVATELTAARDLDAEGARIVGTASYMAPEQATGAPPTPASDWYGVGALLFEALVGSPPFIGSVSDVLRMKSNVQPPAPSACAPGIPNDLDVLCVSLLARAPEDRPDGPTLLRLMGATASAHHVPDSLRPVTEQVAPKLVGRSDQLLALRAAFDATREGRSITVSVSGSSGMGKSSLVQEFLGGLVAAKEAVVLQGRTYERESVPYKAVDGWLDALSRHLLRLSDRGTLFELPEDIWALARLFPVLRRVPEIADVREPPVGDPHRVRRRAFAALRALLDSLAKQHPVVVYVDDVHWGDADSAALLLDLVHPPHAPPLLLVMTYREDQAEGSPLLTDARSLWPRGAEAREVTVGPLDAVDAAHLAQALLGSTDDSSRAAADAVARESQGNPFLIQELVRGHQGPRARAAGEAAVTLEESVAERVERLPDDARKLLETIAVSGRPLPVATVSAAARIVDPHEDHLALLDTERLVRIGLRDGREVVEMVHDRIRDAIVSRIPSDRAREHRVHLAQVLESTPDADAEALAMQLVGIGEKEKAVPYAERGADRAIAKLAFARAVQLLKIAHDGAAPGTAEARRLRLRLAEALAWAGHGGEAARVYLEVAETEQGPARVELERAAAEQLLASGRIDEGGQVLHRVLAAIGMKAPDSTFAAVFWLLIYRLRLALTDLRFQARAATDLRPEVRARIDAMYAVAMGFAVVDVILGACMQARLLLLSIRAGHSEQVMRAAALEGAQLATRGGHPARREQVLFALARRIADGVGTPEADALVEGARGIALFLRGRWAEARDVLDASNAKVSGSRSPWSANATLFAVRSLYFSGRIRELAQRQTRIAADARDRGDLYTLVNFAATTTLTIHLAADDPEGARRQAQEAMAQWSQARFLVQHFQAMAFEPDIDLYIGDGSAAYDRLMRDLPALKSSLLLHVQFVRGTFLYTRGRCAVAAIAGRPARRQALVAEARRAARALDRERMPWTTGLAALVRASAENAAGDSASAIAALREAVTATDAVGMAMHAAAARCRLGDKLGGSEGRALTRAALDAIAAEGIRDAQRWMAIYLPGSWGTPG